MSKPNLQFQGDLMFRALSPYEDGYIIENHRKVKGSLVLHVGEGKNHAHVIEGEDVSVADIPLGNSSPVKALLIEVRGSSAKIMHRDVTTGKAPKDGEGHGTLTLEPGTHIMKTQKEGIDAFSATRVTD